MKQDIVTGGLVLTACLLAFACQAQTKSQLFNNLESGKQQVVVVYGTSLTANGGWVKQLGDALQKRYPDLTTVVNSGGSGMWSKWGIENIETRVVQKEPDTVFIEFCINDSVARFDCSVEQSRANLETMIDGMLKSNPKCEIILMTMTPGDKYSEGHPSYRKNISAYYAMYRAVAEDRHLTLIDHYPNWKALQLKDDRLFLKYVPDTIHPTATGCAEIVTPVILNALGFRDD